MLRNRQMTVRLEKKATKSADPTDIKDEEVLFERKAYLVIRELESLGAKLFVGFCIYVVLDTTRQVLVTKAGKPAS